MARRPRYTGFSKMSPLCVFCDDWFLIRVWLPKQVWTGTRSVAGYFRPCLAYRLNIQCHHELGALWAAISPQSVYSQKHVYLSYLLGKWRLRGISQINLSLLWHISGLHHLHYMHILFTVISMAFHMSFGQNHEHNTNQTKTSPKVSCIVGFSDTIRGRHLRSDKKTFEGYNYVVSKDLPK